MLKLKHWKAIGVALALAVAGVVGIAWATNNDGTGGTSALQVSLYGKLTTAADTPIKADASGNLLVAVPAIDPCMSSNVAKSSVAINITTATTTSLVAISGTTTIYVCGFSMSISQVITTANTIAFVTGTGATCGTGTVSQTGAYGTGGITAAAPIVVSAAGSTLFKSLAGDRLCATTTIGASAAFVGLLTYVQI